jgi:predicted ABC-type ATPase
MSAPLLVMLAGPNGAGKSTFFEAHLKALGLPFLNADVLARTTGLNAYEAAEAIAGIRDQLIEREESFITETVLSDPIGEKVAVLAGAAEAGFDVTLIYIGLESSDLSRDRVRTRVAAGGHDVPPEKLAARYERSLENLERGIARLPRVVIYDNSSFASPHRFLAEFQSGKLIRQGEGSVPAWASRFLER